MKAEKRQGSPSAADSLVLPLFGPAVVSQRTGCSSNHSEACPHPSTE